MSHLTKILDFKKELETAEILDVEAQNKYIEGAFVRAVAANLAKPTSCPKAKLEHIYYMLDKWNSVSPVNGSYVLLRAQQLINKPVLSLQETGLPNIVLEPYLTYDGPAMVDLVRYLKEEIVKYEKSHD